MSAGGRLCAIASPGFALDIGFAAPAGVTALFGHSGAGKTTVVNAVAGLLRPDAARIVLDGEVLVDTEAGRFLPAHRRRHRLCVPGSPAVPASERAAATCSTGAGSRRATAPGPSWSRWWRCWGSARCWTGGRRALSGGERQRVALGRALLSKPRLMLMDEPLAALDAARKDEILPYLERLRDEAGVPILYVSHSAAEVARLATTVVLLEAGRVMRAGPAAEVLADPDAAPLIGIREAGAILTATIAAQEADGLTRLASTAGPLWLPRIDGGPGTRLRVRIEAQDVILSRARPEGLSALNILPARVTQIRLGDGPGALVQLQAGEALLLARLTRRSVAALGLAPGVDCHAVVKSVAVAKSDVGSD